MKRKVFKAQEKGIEDELNDINKVFRTLKIVLYKVKVLGLLTYFGIQFHIERIIKQRSS